ncbi:hypothetical protein KKA47_00695, partial [bacterium]|nr:hypothetical protein [bacterium]
EEIDKFRKIVKNSKSTDMDVLNEQIVVLQEFAKRYPHFKTVNDESEAPAYLNSQVLFDEIYAEAGRIVDVYSISDRYEEINALSKELSAMIFDTVDMTELAEGYPEVKKLLDKYAKKGLIEVPKFLKGDQTKQAARAWDEYNFQARLAMAQNNSEMFRAVFPLKDYRKMVACADEIYECSQQLGARIKELIVIIHVLGNEKMKNVFASDTDILTGYGNAVAVMNDFVAKAVEIRNLEGRIAREKELGDDVRVAESMITDIDKIYGFKSQVEKEMKKQFKILKTSDDINSYSTPFVDLPANRMYNDLSYSAKKMTKEESWVVNFLVSLLSPKYLDDIVDKYLKIFPENKMDKKIVCDDLKGQECTKGEAESMGSEQVELYVKLQYVKAIGKLINQYGNERVVSYFKAMADGASSRELAKVAVNLIVANPGSQDNKMEAIEALTRSNNVHAKIAAYEELSEFAVAQEGIVNVSENTLLRPDPQLKEFREGAYRSVFGSIDRLRIVKNQYSKMNMCKCESLEYMSMLWESVNVALDNTIVRFQKNKTTGEKSKPIHLLDAAQHIFANDYLNKDELMRDAVRFFMYVKDIDIVKDPVRFAREVEALRVAFNTSKIMGEDVSDEVKMEVVDAIERVAGERAAEFLEAVLNPDKYSLDFKEHVAWRELSPKVSSHIRYRITASARADESEERKMECRIEDCEPETILVKQP